MLGVIDNEIKIIDRIINENICDCDKHKAMIILAKYLYINGERDKLNIKETIIQLLSQCFDDFSRKQYENNIDNIINTMCKNISKYNKEPKINHIEKVPITVNEIKVVDSFSDKKVRKIAFILLLYAKINNAFNETDGWINQKRGDILKEARITGSIIEGLKYVHIIYENKYIDNINNESIKINYMDLYENSEVAFYVTDFEHPIYQYLIYEGYNYKKCEVCGKYFKPKTNNHKYCNKCSKEIQKELDKNYQKRKRKLLK